MPYREPRGFGQSTTQAESYAKDKQKTNQLLQDALKKAYRNRGHLQTVWYDLMSLCRMLRAWSRGEYKRVPWRTLVLSLASLIYFLNPLDLVPDFILGVGYLDDAVVLGFVINAIKKELDRFLQWETESGA